MNEVTKSETNATAPRKPRGLGWIFEEWVFNLLLVVAVVAVVAEGVFSLNGPSIV
jgi:hypothetical protein